MNGSKWRGKEEAWGWGRERNRRILFPSQDRQECTAAAVPIPELGSGWGKAA